MGDPVFLDLRGRSQEELEALADMLLDDLLGGDEEAPPEDEA